LFWKHGSFDLAVRWSAWNRMAVLRDPESGATIRSAYWKGWCMIAWRKWGSSNFYLGRVKEILPAYSCIRSATNSLLGHSFFVADYTAMALHRLKPTPKKGKKRGMPRSKHVAVPGASRRFRMSPDALAPVLATLCLGSVWEGGN